MHSFSDLARLSSKALIVAGFAAIALPSPSQADPITTLTFGALVNGVDIQNYYNGGLSSYAPAGDGPNDGLVFSSNATEQRAGFNGTAPNGGTGKFENVPSGTNGVLYFSFSPSTAGYFSDATGFTALSFDYSLLGNSSISGTTVDIWSGINATGTLLAQLALTPSLTPVACNSSHDEFCTWSTATLQGFGVAESASFTVAGSSSAQVEYDDMQITGVPEPDSHLLLAGGLLILLGFARRTRRAVAPTN